MERLTDVDVSAEGLPYLGVGAGRRRRRPVADPAARVHRRARLRDPLPQRRTASTSGTAIIEAGADLDILPFGLEAQRDPSAGEAAHPGRPGHGRAVRPVRRGLPWIVKMDKADFLGRRALVELRRHASRPSDWWACAIEGTVVPPEGAAIVEAGARSAGSPPADGATRSAASSAWAGCRRRAADGESVTIGFGGQTRAGRASAEAVLRPRGSEAPLVTRGDRSTP